MGVLCIDCDVSENVFALTTTGSKTKDQPLRLVHASVGLFSVARIARRHLFLGIAVSPQRAAMAQSFHAS